MKTKIVWPLATLAVGIVVAGIAGLGFWTDRNLDFWLSHFKGEAVDCPLLLSFLVSCLAPLAFTFNLIAEVARLAV